MAQSGEMDHCSPGGIELSFLPSLTRQNVAPAVRGGTPTSCPSGENASAMLVYPASVPAPTGDPSDHFTTDTVPPVPPSASVAPSADIAAANTPELAVSVLASIPSLTFQKRTKRLPEANVTTVDLSGDRAIPVAAEGTAIV